MNPDPRTIHEKNAIPGAEVYGPRCSVCESRRTERLAGARRRCAFCGNEGYIRVTPRGCFVEGDRV